MAKKRGQQADVEPVHGARMLCWWHGADFVSHAIVWMESMRVGEALKPRSVHVLLTDNSGGVVHELHPADSIKYANPTTVTNTVYDFENHFRKKLLSHGGDADAFKYLNVEKPRVEQGERPATQATQELDALYERAARLLKVPEDDLLKKYGHLNNGLQAMNLRNRLRSKGHNV